MNVRRYLLRLAFEIGQASQSTPFWTRNNCK
jgi:hypothetical protein